MPGERIIGLGEALGHLRQAVDYLGDDEHSPYFFIVGAGISAPDIPTARGIIEHCKRVLGRRGKPNEEPTSSAYSRWFSLAYAHPRDRQRYMAGLVSAAKVNAANLFLAHLLLRSKLSRLVVTPNFDDFLVRALRLFGGSPQVCDHPATASRIDPHSRDIQVVHVHGTYHFYDLANLDAEIANRTHGIPSGNAMPELLGRILWDRSPIVIGYSGWENDVIMTTLHRRLGTPLGHNLYWFLHNLDELRSLPEWLRQHGNVYFVVSDVMTRPAMSSDSESPDLTGINRGALDAGQVLHELIVALRLSAPTLLESPLDHFLDQVKYAVSENVGSYDAQYSFDELVTRVTRARDLEREHPAVPVANSGVVAATRKGDLAAVVAEAERLQLTTLRPKQLENVCGSVKFAAYSQQVSSDLKARALKLLTKIEAEKYRRNKAGGALRYVRQLLFAGGQLALLGRYEDAVVDYRALTDEFSVESGDRIGKRVLEAYRLLGLVIGEGLKQPVLALATIEPVIVKASAHPRKAFASRLAALKLTFAELLFLSGRDAIGALDRVFKEYCNATRPAQLYVAARALRVKGDALAASGFLEQAVSAYRHALEYMLHRRMASLYSLRVYRDLTVLLAAGDMPQTVVDITDEALAYLAATEGLRLRPNESTVIWAQILFERANALMKLGDVEAGVALYLQVIERGAGMESVRGQYVGSLIAVFETLLLSRDHQRTRRYAVLVDSAVRRGDSPSWLKARARARKILSKVA